MERETNGLKLELSAALRLDRVNEAFTYVTSRAASLSLLWHKLFLSKQDQNKSRHRPKGWRERRDIRRPSEHVGTAKSLMHAATTSLSTYMLLLHNWHSSPRWAEAHAGIGRRPPQRAAALWWVKAWAVVCGGPSNWVIMEKKEKCVRNNSENCAATTTPKISSRDPAEVLATKNMPVTLSSRTHQREN